MEKIFLKMGELWLAVFGILLLIGAITLPVLVCFLMFEVFDISWKNKAIYGLIFVLVALQIFFTSVLVALQIFLLLFYH